MGDDEIAVNCEERRKREVPRWSKEEHRTCLEAQETSESRDSKGRERPKQEHREEGCFTLRGQDPLE